MPRFYAGQTDYIEQLNALNDEAGGTGGSGSTVAITATSSTSLTIGLGAKNLTIQTGRSYVIGQYLILVNSTNAQNWMVGQVTSHNSTTGELAVNVDDISGSGTHTSWTIGLSGTPGKDGEKGADGGVGQFYVGGNGVLTAATYEYAVAAWNDTGMAVISNIVEITTSGNASSVAISWSQVSGARGYKVMRRVKTTTQWYMFITEGVTSFIDIGAIGVASSFPTSNTGGLVATTVAPLKTVSHPSGLRGRGAWSSSTAYAVEDVATYNGSAYRRKVAGTTTTAPSSDTTNWDLFVSKGADGAAGSGSFPSLVSATITGTTGRSATFPARSSQLTANRSAAFLRATDEINMAEFCEIEEWGGTQHVTIQAVFDAMFDLALAIEPHTQFSSIFKNKYMTAFFPMGLYIIGSPLFVPDYVNVKCYGAIAAERDGSGWLAQDLYYPMMIWSNQSYCEKIQVKCAASGTMGNGLQFGQAWEIKSVTLTGGSNGSGYPANLSSVTARLTTGEYGVLHGEYENAPVTISTDSAGNISSISFAGSGYYRTRPSGLPGYVAPDLSLKDGTGNVTQTEIDNASNGKNTLRISYNGNDSGRAVVTWMNRYSGSGSARHWNVGRGYEIFHGKIGDIEVFNAGETISSLRGPMFCFCSSGMNVRIDQVMTQYGYYAIDFYKSVDTHANFLNPVGGLVGIRWKSGGAFTCPTFVVDSPAGEGLRIDDFADITIRGHMFSINGNDDVYNMPTGIVRTAAIKIGTSSGNMVHKLTLECMMEGMGTEGLVPALDIDRCTMSQINLLVANQDVSLGTTHVNLLKRHNRFAKIGPNVTSSVLLTGSFDNIGTPFEYTGTTTPVCGIHVYDGTERIMYTNQTTRNVNWGSGLGT